MSGHFFEQINLLLTDPMELTAAITGFICVWLAAKENVWNWPVSLVSTLIYAVVFYQSKLYSDAVLQAVFTFFQIYGWYQWSNKQTNSNSPTVTILSKKSRITATISLVLIWLIWYFLLIRIKPDAALPVWDSLTTCISLVAIFLQARKKLENWFLWIVADLIYIPVYIQKELIITALLYLLFLILAIYGYRKWRAGMTVL